MFDIDRQIHYTCIDMFLGYCGPLGNFNSREQGSFIVIRMWLHSKCLSLVVYRKPFAFCGPLTDKSKYITCHGQRVWPIAMGTWYTLRTPHRVLISFTYMKIGSVTPSGDLKGTTSVLWSHHPKTQAVHTYIIMPRADRFQLDWFIALKWTDKPSSNWMMYQVKSGQGIR